MDRRSALKGIGLIIASATAPAIIPIKNIMPVKAIIKPTGWQTMYASVKVSDEFYKDVGNSESFIMDELAKSLDIAFNNSFINGAPLE